MKQKLAFLIALVILLSLQTGCTQSEPEIPPETDSTESLVQEIIPALTYGILECEPLGILPWDTDRLAVTACNTMAETSMGLYFSTGSQLLYADKDSLNLWIPVCNQPSCSHKDATACSAVMISKYFVIKDGRIFLEKSSSIFPEYAQSLGNILVSMAHDGTDMQKAYVLEEGMLKGAGAHRSLLLPDCWLYFSNTLETDGSTRAKMFYVNQDGVSTIVNTSWETGYPEFHCAVEWDRLYGDRYFYYEVLSKDLLFHFKDGKQLSLPISYLPPQGGYISGTTLRTFQQNDGYYDTNIQTGETVKLAQNQLENSHAVILLPNCILETTLLWDSVGMRQADTQQELLLFNGEKWLPVQLPNELRNASQTEYIRICGVASDCIYFLHMNTAFSVRLNGFCSLYRIPLGTQTLTAEFCGDIRIN